MSSDRSDRSTGRLQEQEQERATTPRDRRVTGASGWMVPCRLTKTRAHLTATAAASSKDRKPRRRARCQRETKLLPTRTIPPAPLPPLHFLTRAENAGTHTRGLGAKREPKKRFKVLASERNKSLSGAGAATSTTMRFLPLLVACSWLSSIARAGSLHDLSSSSQTSRIRREPAGEDQQQPQQQPQLQQPHQQQHPYSPKAIELALDSWNGFPPNLRQVGYPYLDHLDHKQRTNETTFALCSRWRRCQCMSPNAPYTITIHALTVSGKQHNQPKKR